MLTKLDRGDVMICDVSHGGRIARHST